MGQGDERGAEERAVQRCSVGSETSTLLLGTSIAPDGTGISGRRGGSRGWLSLA